MLLIGVAPKKIMDLTRCGQVPISPLGPIFLHPCRKSDVEVAGPRAMPLFSHVGQTE
jgi:hypothetical protein